MSRDVRLDVKSRHDPAATGFAMYSHGGDEVRVEAISIGADGERRTLKANGFSRGSRGESINFYDTIPPTPGARIDRLIISANVPVEVSRITWWSGDASKRITWP